MSVQFSGGEPTISPHFLEATRYAPRDRLLLGPVRHERDPLRAGARVRARGLRRGPAPRVPPVRRRRNENNLHRGVGNLYDVKLRALDNLHAAGIDVTLVTTIVNTVNNDQVGAISEVRDREHRQDQRPLLPARLLHGPRRGDRRRVAQDAALHALAPRARREGAGGRRRADARLVPALGVGAVLGPPRPPRRPGRAVGVAQVRLPPELRDRDDDAREARHGPGRARDPDPGRGPSAAGT